MKNPRIELIKKLKQTLELSDNCTDTALANHLGSTSQKQNSWKTKLAKWQNKSTGPLSNTEILNLVKDVRHTSVKKTQDKIHREFISTIVEYYPIEKVTSKGGKSFEISPPEAMKEEGEWKAIRSDLEKTSTGIYIFYDSSSRAIYVGKTAGQKGSLWARMKSSFNADQQKSRQQYRIDHHKRDKVNTRNLGQKGVQLHELAKYFSAYKVEPQFTHNIEALLIRAFADNLMNKKMEKFRPPR